MYRFYQPSAEAQAVLAHLEQADLLTAEAILLSEAGVCPVNGLLALLNRHDEYIIIPVYIQHLPKRLYEDVVYLRPFADVAERIKAPFGVDTVYQIKPRPKYRGTGAYRLPAPARYYALPAPAED
jgi:hypothetical protein